MAMVVNKPTESQYASWQNQFPGQLTRNYNDYLYMLSRIRSGAPMAQQAPQMSMNNVPMQTAYGLGFQAPSQNPAVMPMASSASMRKPLSSVVGKINRPVQSGKVKRKQSSGGSSISNWLLSKYFSRSSYA